MENKICSWYSPQKRIFAYVLRYIGELLDTRTAGNEKQLQRKVCSCPGDNYVQYIRKEYVLTVVGEQLF